MMKKQEEENLEYSPKMKHTINKKELRTNNMKYPQKV